MEVSRYEGQRGRDQKIARPHGPLRIIYHPDGRVEVFARSDGRKLMEGADNVPDFKGIQPGAGSQS